MRASRRRTGDSPIGFAHRGARAECRDNTMRSFDRALALGARGLETDAWVTADGVVVLDHDGVVRRGLRRVGIAELRRDELPAHVPALAELLAVCDDGVDLSLDIKDAATAAPTIALIESAGRAERTWLCGREADLLRWRERSAHVRLVASARTPDGLGDRLHRLAASGIDAVNLRWPAWHPGLVDRVHNAGLLAFAWDAQRAATIASMVTMGVDGLYSDHVARMVAVLAAARHDPSVA